jgi:hypothetical protein
MAKHGSEIIAFHLGCDIRDVTDGRYQPSRYSNPPVYVCGEDYFCAPTERQELPGQDFDWKQVGEWYGRKVYRAQPRAA